MARMPLLVLPPCGHPEPPEHRHGDRGQYHRITDQGEEGHHGLRGRIRAAQELACEAEIGKAEGDHRGAQQQSARGETGHDAGDRPAVLSQGRARR